MKRNNNFLISTDKVLKNLIYTVLKLASLKPNSETIKRLT